MVYVDTRNSGLCALDAATGHKRWAFTAGGWAFSTPVVVDGVIYVGSDDEHLYALDAATGEQRWAFATSEVVDCAPVVVNGLVYVSSSRLYAVNAATGRLRWSLNGAKYKIAGAGYRHLCSPDGRGRRGLRRSKDSTVYAVQT